MATSNINVVALTGNLTRDPELRSTNSGMSVCSLRVANNQRRKVGDEWTDVPGYYDVTVWGGQADACARFLSKGRPVAIQGRLEWREWEKDGQKRQAIQIVADTVQFLGGRDDDQRPDDSPGGYVPEPAPDIAFAFESPPACDALKGTSRA